MTMGDRHCDIAELVFPRMRTTEGAIEGRIPSLDLLSCDYRFPRVAVMLPVRLTAKATNTRLDPRIA
jgi:hypothetical protein